MSFTSIILTNSLDDLVTTGTVTDQFDLEQRKDCTAFDFLLDPACGWNCTHCLADSNYYQLVCVASDTPDPACLTVACAETDILSFVFQQPDYFNVWDGSPQSFGWSSTQTGDWFATVEVYEASDPCNPVLCEEAVFDDYAVSYYVGGFFRGTTVQGIQIDPTTLPCRFMLKFIFNRPTGDPFACYTEPYKKVECEKTISLEGLYSETGSGAYDCDGKYYGVPPAYLGTLFHYSNKIRLEGQAFIKDYNIKPTLKTNFTGKQRIVSETNSTANVHVRTTRVPPYIARKMRTILSAQNVLINEEAVIAETTLSKNTKFGEMWLLDFDVIVNDCQSTKFTCVDA